MRWLSRILLLVLLLSPPLSRALADEEAARYFAGRGEEDLATGKHADAETNFTKALGEKADFLPALLGLAKVAVARQEKEKAIGGLEDILDRFDRGETKGQAELVTQAEDLLKELDRSRLEYRKLVGTYVEQVSALAESSVKENPDLARRCLARILLVAPNHPAAARLQKEHGITPAAEGASAPTAAGAPEEAVVLMDGSSTDAWTSAGTGKAWCIENGLFVGQAGTEAYFTRHPKIFEGDYTLVIEGRIREDTDDIPAILFGLGYKGMYECVELVIFEDKFRLQRFNGGEDTKTFFGPDLPFYMVDGGFDRTRFHRFEFRVKGKKLLVLVDGKQIFDADVESPSVLEGSVTLTTQDVTCEIRKVYVVPN